jgi:AcrR family transcriptional regulator
MMPFGGGTPTGGVGGRRSMSPGSNDSPRELVNTVQRLWILSAMAKIACEQGPQSVTVAQVMARAGVSRRKFYDLFESCDDCFRATFEEAIAVAAESVLPAYEAEGRWVDRMRAGLQALLEFFDREPELAKVCVVHAQQGSSQTLARRSEVLARLAEAVEEGGTAIRRASQPLPLTSEGSVGAVLSVIHARLLDPKQTSLKDLLNPLTAMIIAPYLGLKVARRELARPAPEAPAAPPKAKDAHDPLEDLDMRLTYRTLQVLAAIAAAPGISNREVAAAAGVQDQGQISKLLARVQREGLARNIGPGQSRGGANAWTLTSRGAEVGKAAGFGNGRNGQHH